MRSRRQSGEGGLWGGDRRDGLVGLLVALLALFSGVRAGSGALTGTAGPDTCASGPAGVVLYHQAGPTVYLLLADHVAPSQRGWAGFGGAPEAGESLAQTAAREAEEETRGAFRRADLLAQLAGQHPTPDPSGFSLFFARVDSLSADSLPLLAVPEGQPAYRERGPYAWVPFSAVAPFVQPATDAGPGPHLLPAGLLPAGSRTNWLWPVWLGNLRHAATQGALPWDRHTVGAP